MEKRKAAADIFMEQNVMLQEQEEAPQPQLAATFAAAGQAAPGAPLPPPPAKLRSQSRAPVFGGGLKTSEELQLEKEPIRVRETGFGIWKSVIVPPNVYVVHTRKGRDKPRTIGLGCSFGYNPLTDSYLVVPAAMQTIGVVANCISKEKQGINVLAYVQWQIADFSVAYRKLDFSDSRDPLGIVNAQLREQAEAAIKDKIATMSVEDVLTDKEPVIEELTTRLKAVAEGRGQNADEGLGIKIVTVQIKEALVSSQRLWENLQAPFRFDQEKRARISQLLAQDEVLRKELETRQFAETGEAETRVAIERITQTKQTEAAELRLTEEARRFLREQEHERERLQLTEQTTVAQRETEQRLQLQALEAQQALALARLRREQAESIERVRLDAEARARQKALQVDQAVQELAEAARLATRQLEADLAAYANETTRTSRASDLQRLQHEQAAELQRIALAATLARQREEADARLAVEAAAAEQRQAIAEREAVLERTRLETQNLVNERALTGRLVAQLPELAAHMPEVHELTVLQTGAGGAFDSFAQFLAATVALAERLGLKLPGRADGDHAQPGAPG